MGREKCRQNWRWRSEVGQLFGDCSLLGEPETNTPQRYRYGKPQQTLLNQKGVNVRCRRIITSESRAGGASIRYATP